MIPIIFLPVAPFNWVFFSFPGWGSVDGGDMSCQSDELAFLFQQEQCSYE